MQWFFEGVAAQKAAQPGVRASDIVTFEAMRKPRVVPAYREPGLGPDEVRRRFFLDLIRQHNHMFDVTLTPSEEDIEAGMGLLKLMAEQGLKTDSWVITNILAGRTGRIRDYKGGAELVALYEKLKQGQAHS